MKFDQPATSGRDGQFPKVFLVTADLPCRSHDYVVSPGAGARARLSNCACPYAANAANAPNVADAKGRDGLSGNQDVQRLRDIADAHAQIGGALPVNYHA